ncbi:hypothetical protein IWQ62_004455 [Dispira parvispora]|uniref:MRN complex-interacting protein N-terminal domain-containing protein n=1 Tax=Dispira parvispora TaxID=1520584 RepID=A0A9W8ALK6_9FUNG|nr:hypothetical protein IWQ62_004455 [Dispira parvispora]
MPTFWVLRCFDEHCSAFQVHQTKKSKKWQCKLCHQKQSVKRILFESEDPSQCREIVQKMNLQRGQSQDNLGFQTYTQADLQPPVCNVPSSNEGISPGDPVGTEQDNIIRSPPTGSKWEGYIDATASPPGSESEPDDSAPRFTTTIPSQMNSQKTRRVTGKGGRARRQEISATSTSNRKPPTKRPRTASTTDNASWKQTKMSAFLQASRKQPSPAAIPPVVIELPSSPVSSSSTDPRSTRQASDDYPSPTPVVPPASLEKSPSPTTKILPLTSTPALQNESSFVSDSPRLPNPPAIASLPSAKPQTKRDLLFDALKRLNRHQCTKATTLTTSPRHASNTDESGILATLPSDQSSVTKPTSRWGQYYEPSDSDEDG